MGLNGRGPSLGEWLDEGGYSRKFVERLIVPQASAVWSADPAQMWSFPASFLAEFFDNHGMFELTGRPRWRTVAGGSRGYVEALIEPFARPRAAVDAGAADRALRGPRGGDPAGRRARALRRGDRGRALRPGAGHARRPERRRARGARRDPLPAATRPCSTPTRSLLPRRRRAWASWNYHLQDEPTGRTTVTYHMNRLQSLRADREFCVTLNRTEAIDPEQVVRTIEYHHPVYTNAGLRAQGRWDEVNGVRRTYFCGAYWGSGFHEDGVQSALRVCERFGRGSHERQRALRGLGAPPPLRAGGARVPLPHLHGLPRPRRAAGRARRLPLVASARRPAAVWFRRADYLGDPAQPLREAVLDAVEAQGGARPAGPVRLLTHLRTFGHSLQPGELLLLLRPAGERVEAVLAEVTNTPWGERHAYVLERGDAGGRVLRDRMDKVFHVSPFLPHGGRLRVARERAGRALQVHIESTARASRPRCRSSGAS